MQMIQLYGRVFIFLTALHAAGHVDDTSNLTLRNELYAHIFPDAESCRSQSRNICVGEVLDRCWWRCRASAARRTRGRTERRCGVFLKKGCGLRDFTLSS